MPPASGVNARKTAANAGAACLREKTDAETSPPLAYHHHPSQEMMIRDPVR